MLDESGRPSNLCAPRTFGGEYQQSTARAAGIEEQFRNLLARFEAVVMRMIGITQQK